MSTTAARARLGGVLISAVLVVAGAACSSGGSGDGSEGADRSGASTTTVAEAGDPGAVALPRLSAEADPDGTGRIVDADGREVRLRGVNVNALAEYWSGRDDAPTVFPLAEDDPEAIAGTGWNTVRLLLSWSRIEPRPGDYDDAYLREAAEVVDRFAAVGVYSIIDLHQDAWGLTLAAPDGTTCPDGQTPALGWDGAPGWATLDGDAPRCTPGGIRELSPAVMAAWEAFFTDAPGPGGVGLAERYVAMLAHVAGSFAPDDAVAGIDVMNEPGALNEDQAAALSRLYERAVEAIRIAEDEAGAEPHLVLFEPPALWSSVGSGPPPPFAHDGQVVYAPHIYTGGFTNGPIGSGAFETALEEARTFGGVPVLSGEWGADPARAGPEGDGYFLDHQRLQDSYGVSATLWTWRESCGDPHKIEAHRNDEVPEVWGLFDVDCRTNEVEGRRTALVEDLRRGWVRAAPGTLAETAWDPDTGELTASGSGAEPGIDLLAWMPCESPGDVEVAAIEGLGAPEVVAGPGGGCVLTAPAEGDRWSLAATSG